MSETRQELAAAKLNLLLLIRGRRGDGYHELATVMVAIDWADTVRVSLTAEPGVRLTVSGDWEVPAGPANLAWRAASLFVERSGCHCGVAIELTKRIPPGAGLGGGSSDAGAVLRALRRLAAPAVPAAALVEWAAELGSDVPFFAAGCAAALCEGRGERVRPLRSGLVGSPVLVVYPGFGCATRDIYRRWRKSLTSIPPEPKMIIAALEAGLAETVGRSAYNALAEAVMGKFPILALIREQLAATGVLGTGLTGSGSSLFGLYRDRQEAGQAKEALAQRFGTSLTVCLASCIDPGGVEAAGWRSPK